MHFIYCLQNKINLKIYIGQTNNLDRRWKQHKSASRSKKPQLLISRAMAKYGIDNFIYQFIESHDSQEDVDQAEIFWIQYFQSQNREIGYNLNIGGNNPPVSDETRKKISLALKGKVSPFLGTKGILKANSTSFKPKINWPTDQELMNLINKYGIVGAANVLNIAASSISLRIEERDIRYTKLYNSSLFTGGSNHPQSKLNENQVLEIVMLYNAGSCTQLQLAEKFNVTRSAISSIITGKRWNHITKIV